MKKQLVIGGLALAFTSGVWGADALTNNAERTTFCVIEDMLATIADKIEKTTCALTKGTYDLSIETDYDGTTYSAVVDELDVSGSIVQSNTKGTKVKSEFSGEFDQVAVTQGKGSCALSRDATIAFGSGSSYLNNDKFDYTWIKDWYPTTKVPRQRDCNWYEEGCAVRTGAVDWGIEGVTKQGFPRAKWSQYSEYVRPNGVDGRVFVEKRQFAPHGAPACKIVLEAAADDFGDWLDVWGEVKVVPCTAPNGDWQQGNCKDEFPAPHPALGNTVAP